jgi:hypothetical protein
MIYPRCKSDHDQIYVNAEGILLPCCWIGNEPHLEEYKKFLGNELYSGCDLGKVDFSTALNGPAQKKLENSWSSTQPFSACQLYCSQRLEQRECANKQGTNERARLSLS